MSDINVVGTLVLGCLLCAIAAWLGFDRPTWTRSYTTMARFRGARLMHVFLYVVTFLIVFGLLHAIFEVLGKQDVDQEPDTVMAIVWLALGADADLSDGVGWAAAVAASYGRHPFAWASTRDGAHRK